MIRRIRDRGTFQRLTSHGVRLRRSVLWCRWCPDPEQTATTVAFAINRACGPAVVRNRTRRRLREALRTIDQIDPLPPGALLIGTKPAATELTFEQLSSELAAMIRQLRTVEPRA